MNLGSLNLTDPLLLKAGGGLALLTLGRSRTAELAGLALLGWAAWEYFQTPARPPAKVIPYDPDAPMPLEQAAASSPDPFKGTRWENSPLAPSVRPLRPGETPPEGGKVIPLRPPTQEERAMFYGINPGPENVG